ncbi:hypothetical protein AXG93_2556s1100 [Marchantia polymorpha subsp. ruderalis]|uniref:Uncharacterized protein n=1 Tax=Marchantia polymorpha subsp. ruderalis TaxID=1480154 RepID=A0A176VD53_MARPO|nr:hypothetical protein AXG93_2556s1100 [Marchantia polymorpha subsp. ruderalis]
MEEQEQEEEKGDGCVRTHLQNEGRPGIPGAAVKFGLFSSRSARAREEPRSPEACSTYFGVQLALICFALYRMLGPRIRSIHVVGVTSAISYCWSGLPRTPSLALNSSSDGQVAGMGPFQRSHVGDLSVGLGPGLEGGWLCDLSISGPSFPPPPTLVISMLIILPIRRSDDMVWPVKGTTLDIDGNLIDSMVRNSSVTKHR